MEKQTKQSFWARLKASFARRRPVVLTGVIVAVLSMTVYVGLDTWMTNNRLSLYGLRPAVASGDGLSIQSDSARQAQEGSDESTIPDNALENYIVAPDMPRALFIDKVGVKARVLPMGVNPDGTIQAPKNIFDSGWYTGSVKPGEKGAVFIDGHASGATRQGLFANLDQLVAGDTVRLEKGDGTALLYEVTKVESANKDSIDMRNLLKPHGDTEYGLNLMTCTGNWIEDQKTYDQRVIVYTKQVL